MNEADFNRSLKQGCDLFQELGLMRAFLVPNSLPTNARFNQIALDTERPYEEVFFAGLKEGQLNFILGDLTYFQFSRESATEARYAFYPSPFSASSVVLLRKYLEVRDNGWLDDESFQHAIEALPINNRRPVLRYEYSESQHKKIRHPISHLHIGTYGEDRWSVEKFLTPYAFCLQVAKMYFGEHWEALTEEDGPLRRNPFDAYLVAEKAACLISPIERFCDDERQHFFIK